jgi:outer membrane protein TolC
MTARVALMAATLTLSACAAFGPDRKPPKMPLPEHYSVEAPSAQLPVADGVAQKLDANAKPVPQWWKAYQSDELNGLVEEGLENSPSLAAGSA